MYINLVGLTVRKLADEAAPGEASVRSRDACRSALGSTASPPTGVSMRSAPRAGAPRQRLGHSRRRTAGTHRARRSRLARIVSRRAPCACDRRAARTGGPLRTARSHLAGLSPRCSCCRGVSSPCSSCATSQLTRPELATRIVSAHKPATKISGRFGQTATRLAQWSMIVLADADVSSAVYD
jgi:hypothetical protein